MAWVRALYSLGIKPSQKLNYAISAEVHTILQAPWQGSRQPSTVLYIPGNIIFLKGGRVSVLHSKSVTGAPGPDVPGLHMAVQIKIQEVFSIIRGHNQDEIQLQAFRSDHLSQICMKR